jgi:hypothetical protein
MADEEVKGYLILKKDSLIFRSETGMGRGNLKHLKKLDSELFEEEIKKMEDQDKNEWEGTIDFDDIIDVKIIVMASNVQIQDEIEQDMI